LEPFAGGDGDEEVSRRRREVGEVAARETRDPVLAVRSFQRMLPEIVRHFAKDSPRGVGSNPPAGVFGIGTVFVIRRRYIDARSIVERRLHERVLHVRGGREPRAVRREVRRAFLVV